MVVTNGRKRRTWVRSQRGCKTCRLRHVKCDETFPSCKRCAVARRVCDGCAPPDEWEVVTVSSLSSTSSASPSPERQLALRQPDERSDVSFAFFRQHTVNYLAGLLDQHWGPLILRTIEQNDVLYHAALAIGSVHKTVLAKQQLDVDLDVDRYAVKHYTKALRLLSPGADGVAPPIEVMLTACLLFVGFESLRGNHGVVLQHVQSGVSILRQHLLAVKTIKDEERQIPVRSLVPAFARMDRQLQELTGCETPLLQDLAQEQTASGYFEYGGPEPQPVPHFPDLKAAWTSLHQRWHSLIGWVGYIHIDWFNHLGDIHKDSNLFATPFDPQVDIDVWHAKLTRDFELWSLGMEELRGRLANLSPKEEAIWSLLQCHIILAKSVLETAAHPTYDLWDQYTDEFREIVRLCRIVVEQEMLDSASIVKELPAKIIVHHRFSPADVTDDSSGQDNATQPLTFDMSVCMILLHVVSKCRDARVRLHAITLLEDYPRLEGLWFGVLIAKAGRIIDWVERQGWTLEEAAERGAGSEEIPLERRILDLRANMHVNSRSGDLILHTKKRIWEPGTVSTTITLTW